MNKKIPVDKIHNIWLFIEGKAEGIAEAGGKADFPVLFTEAILEYYKSLKGVQDE
jgi:hypothetical protein